MTSRIPAVFDAGDPCSPLSIPNKQTALLLMDYQNLMMAMMGEPAARVVSTARSLQKWATENKIMVVHCLVDTSSGSAPAPYMKSAGRFKALRAKLQESPALGNECAELAKISEDEKTDARRPGYVSALQGPKLRQMLAAADIKSLILGGISTSGCVLGTCRAATDADYVVTVVEDACVDPTPGLHDMLVQHVLSSTAHVTKSTELMNVWKVEA